jgi:hypothetical protein
VKASYLLLLVSKSLCLDLVVEHDELSVEELRGLIKSSLLEKELTLFLQSPAWIDALGCARSGSTREMATGNSIKLTVFHIVPARELWVMLN